MSETPLETAIDHQTLPAPAWTQGWNWLVIAIVAIAPLVLILVEYKLRDELCALHLVESCHPLDFFAPTMMAAALTMALPCLSMPGSLPVLKVLPDPPSIFKHAARRQWLRANRLAIHHNRRKRYQWYASATVAIFAFFLSCGIFTIWLLRLHPEGSASIGVTWGKPQEESCIAYALATTLTLAQTSLERYQK
ncbi:MULTISPECIES: hypothetical protein [unclassified Paraburkholderia]|uniref:hypothetical protein n=1 Tax=unclassified Paraburkholderia TaxID=2615204 RepID=UPI002AAF386E|nr:MULTISPECIES: hypothetical protein [unclassified Paraburkholderia]